MKKIKLAIVFSMALVLVMASGVFAQNIVTHSTASGDTWSTHAPASGPVNSLILNGDFQSWTGGTPDHWTSWEGGHAGWITARLHALDMTVPWDASGESNAMGWYIQHDGARSGPAYAGAYQHLTEIPSAGYYFVNTGVTAYWVRGTGPYNSVAWYAISSAEKPGEVAASEWRELYPSVFVCPNVGSCTYTGRNETVWIEPGQYFHLRVAQKFPVLFAGTFFVLDDVSIVAADPTVETANDPHGYYRWVKTTVNTDDQQWHYFSQSAPPGYVGNTVVRWTPHMPR